MTSEPRRRILIIEDDEAIATGLAMNLRFEGHDVEVRGDGESGVKRALEERPDLVVLDLMLPRMNGYEVCRAIRAAGNGPAILILSAKGAEEDKVLGLDLGADDYVTKPFGIKEVLARVQAVLRRQGSAPTRVVRFGDVEVDLGAHAVTRAGARVELTAREILLLQLFVTRPGRVLTRQALLDGAWHGDYEGSARTVDNFVRRLRVKLEPDPDAPRHFVTVVGLGYRFDP
jgi:DNA-binding response OmpR family regulator